MNKKQYGVTIVYTETNSNRRYSQYREYKKLGSAAQNFVDKINKNKNLNIQSIRVVNTKNEKVQHNLKF